MLFAQGGALQPSYGESEVIEIVLPYAPQYDFNVLNTLDFTQDTPPIALEDEILSAKDYLQEEYRWLLSALVYGFRFEYVPSDEKRQVQEQWDLVLINEVRQQEYEIEALYHGGSPVPLFQVRYNLSLGEIAYKKRSRDSGYAFASGKNINALRETDTRIEATKEAIKEAIRWYWRQKIYNKPASMSGEIILRDPPYLWVENGEYFSTVTIAIKTKKIKKYDFF